MAFVACGNANSLIAFPKASRFATSAIRVRISVSNLDSSSCSLINIAACFSTMASAFLV